MQCLYCGGPFEWAGQSARCMRCLNIFSQQGGRLTPLVVKAPDGSSLQWESRPRCCHWQRRASRKRPRMPLRRQSLTERQELLAASDAVHA